MPVIKPRSQYLSQESRICTICDDYFPSGNALFQHLPICRDSQRKEKGIKQQRKEEKSSDKLEKNSEAKFAKLEGIGKDIKRDQGKTIRRDFILFYGGNLFF